MAFFKSRNLLKDTGYLDIKAFDSLFFDLDEVAAILCAILKKTRIKKRTDH